MATEKNITMKQFNGTDYDTLYPQTIASQIPDVYSKTEVLTTETLSKYGLTADKLPNDVFQQIKTLIDNAQASADGKAKIQTGNYVGTGTYGASNPCRLTFDGIPQFVIVMSASDGTLADYNQNLESCFIAINGITNYYNKIAQSMGNYKGPTFIWNDTSFNWYGDNANTQCNNSQTKYYWFTIL